MGNESLISTENKIETLIVGGGVAGLACARRLHETGQEFLLVSEDIGGRLAISDRGHPLGAVMINRDYQHIAEFARKSHSSRPWNSYIWDGERARNFLTRINPLQLLPLAKALREFGPALNKLRAAAPYHCQKSLMESDPVLRVMVDTSAQDFVREKGIESLADSFFGPVVSAVFLTDWKSMSAFHFCIGVSCISNGAYCADWSDTLDRMTEGYRDRLVGDTAVTVHFNEGGQYWQVKCGSGEYRARNLVLAVPGPGTDRLLGGSSPVRAVDCKVVHVQGQRKPPYKPGKTLLLGAGNEVELIYTQPDGVDIVYMSCDQADLGKYYDDYQVLAERQWRPATQLSGREWRPLQPEDNLFTIGDYNICGLEDAYLTGLYAANRIAGNSR